MKKTYMHPTMKVVEIKQRQQLLAGSPTVNNLEGFEGYRGYSDGNDEAD